MSDFTSDFILLVPAVQPRAVFAIFIMDFSVGIVKDLFIRYEIFVYYRINKSFTMATPKPAMVTAKSALGWTADTNVRCLARDWIVHLTI